MSIISGYIDWKRNLFTLSKIIKAENSVILPEGLQVILQSSWKVAIFKGGK
jgi:hypothetical protein